MRIVQGSAIGMRSAAAAGSVRYLSSTIPTNPLIESNPVARSGASTAAASAPILLAWNGIHRPGAAA